MTDLAVLGLAIDSSQAASASSALEKLVAAANSMQAAADKLTAGMQKTAAATKQVAQASGEAKLQAGFAGAAVQAQADATNRAASELMKHGAATRANAASMAGLVSAHAGATHATNEHAKALHGHTAAVGINRMQQMELAHITRALMDEMAAGQNPIRALMMESGRISQVLSSGSGGLGAVMKSLGGTLASLATGWVGLSAVTLAAVGVAGYAAYSYADSQDKLSAAIEGTGRRAGVTLSQLNALSAAGAKSGNISLGQSQGLAAGFVGAGIDATTTAGLIGSSKRYGQITGQSTDEAGAELAKAFKDPSAGAEGVNKSLSFLNDRILQTVQDFQASGNIEGARRTLMQGYLDAVKETTDRTWTFSKALEISRNRVSDFLNGFGKAIVGPADRREELTDEIKRREEALTGLMTREPSFLRPQVKPTDFIAKYERTEIDKLKAELAPLDNKANGEASAKKAEADANALSMQASIAVKAILPNFGRSSDIENKIELLTKVLSDPAAMEKMHGDGSQVNQALVNLQNQRAFADPFTRIREDAKLAVDSINAYSLAERVEVEARRAAVQVMRESGDVLQANAAAESSRNQLIARANSEAYLYNEKTKQDASLVGLSPVQKQLRQIDIASKDFTDKNVSSKSELNQAFTPFQNVVATTTTTFGNGLTKSGNAATRHAETLDAASARIAGAVFAAAGSAGGANAPSGGIGSDTAALLRSKEGFRSSAYWDVNHWRAGYGSDTSTGPDGKVSSVTQGTTVSKEDAERDLNRRVEEFSQRAQNQIGPAFAALGSNVKTALVSMSYNYGSLPKDVAAVARGGNLSALAAAVDSHANDNGGVNAGRRHGEAKLIDPLALTAGADRKEGDNRAKSTVLQSNIIEPFQLAQQSIEAMGRETNLLTSTFGKSKAEIYGENAALKLEEEYRRSGTYAAAESAGRLGELKDKIKEVGSESTEAAKKLFAAQKAQQDSIATQDSVRATSSDLIGSPLKAIAHGEDPAKALQAAGMRLVDKLIDNATSTITSSLFGAQGQSGGGILSGLLGSVLGGGGGGDKAINTASATITAGSVSLNGGLGGLGGGGDSSGGGSGNFLTDILGSLFGSPTGGGGIGGIGHNAGGTDNWRGGATWVGERGPELVNLPAGAQVIPNGASARQSGNDNAPVVNVAHTIINSTSSRVETKTTRQSNGQVQIQTMVRDAMLDDHATNGPYSRALQGTFGLNRAAGRG